jgi:hypothetical protein
LGQHTRQLIGSDDLDRDARKRSLSDIVRGLSRDQTAMAMSPGIGKRGFDRVKTIEPKPAAAPQLGISFRHSSTLRRGNRQRERRLRGARFY